MHPRWYDGSIGVLEVDTNFTSRERRHSEQHVGRSEMLSSIFLVIFHGLAPSACRCLWIICNNAPRLPFITKTCPRIQKPNQYNQNPILIPQTLHFPCDWIYVTRTKQEGKDPPRAP